MNRLIPHFADFKKEQEGFEKMKKEHESLFRKDYIDFENNFRNIFKKKKIEYSSESTNSLAWFKISFSVNKKRFQVIARNGSVALETYHDMDPGFPTMGTPQPHGDLIRRWKKFEKFEKEFLKEAEKFTQKK